MKLAAVAIAVFPLQALALDLHGLKPDEVAVWAAPVDGGAALAQHRADAVVNPASTMKLVTGWAALNKLGPNYRWVTELKAAAPLRDGVLQGDLYWPGSGDPRLDDAGLRELAHQLRLRGVERIAGKLVLDKSAFSRVSAADDFEEDAGRAFTVTPDTHLTNLKVAWLTFFHDGMGARAALDPPLPGVTVDSRLKTGGAGECGDVRHHVSIKIQGERVEASGTLPAACDGARAYVNLLEHDRFAAGDFAAQWQALGGQGLQGYALGRAPEGAQTLARYESPPLSVTLADINKYSNNTMARQLYLTLGKEDAGGADTLRNAEHAVRAQLAEAHIDDAALALENGSGLSRRERVSARLLGQVLLAAARGPWSGEFIATLPIAGVDGTLKRRFPDAGPRLRLKTGTLKNAKALAGYWQAPDGRRLALAVIVNSPRALETGKAMDAIVADLIERF